MAMWRRRRKPFPHWLDRVLGPGEPYLSCDDCFEQLDRYVELELAGADADAEMPLVKGHLTGCPACRDDHDALLEFARAEQR
jgi:hypothetical protein